MDAGEFYDEDFFRAVRASGARVLLIGRRALVALGAPVLTSDYDVWVHFDDVERLNAAFAPLDHFPNHPPDEARRRGRYVLENGQRIDVMLARSKAGPDGAVLSFDEAWRDRQTLDVGAGLTVDLPSLPHLVATKRWGMRPRDLADIEWLTLLRKGSDP